jgi:spermidine synthase
MSERPVPVSAAERVLPAMLALFVGSGCAALIYEVVWFQLLQLSLGSSAVSMGVLLGTFMGGMCLGSWLFPKKVDAKHHPLKVYAYLEIGIGICGLLILFIVPLLGGVYAAVAGSGPFSVFLRGIVASIVLLPPTLMMGATLPAISRWVEATPRGVSWLGFFYGGNIAGAVIGCLLAGFYLLRVFDMTITTVVAAAINALVGVLALTLASRAPYEAPVPGDAKAEGAPGSGVVYVTIALSGLTALAAQVVWTRVLSLLFGATVYTFSLILAVFLVGLGIGSSLGSSMAHTLKNPRAALGWAQMLLCVALAYAAYMTTASMPYWPVNPQIQTNTFFQFQLDLMRAAFTILPGAMLWGMSFPLALASVARKGQDPARLVGGVYAANTVGAIVGAVFASILAIKWFGSQHTQMALIGVSAISGLLMLASANDETGKGKTQVASMALLIIVTGGAGLLARTVPPMPGILVAYGRYAATWVGQNDIFYTGEGMTASVAVSRTPTGVLNYHNAGKVQASSEPQDTRLERMLGHITTVTHPNPLNVFVIGCGAAVTAGAVSIDPRVKDQLIAEIEPLVPHVVADYFSEHNFNVLHNPKVRLHIDDARHYLLTTKETYDAITSDPLDQWVKGAATLYTREFFNVMKAHLKPGGVLTLWVHLYETDAITVKSELATFFEAFPNGAVFANLNNGQGYDLVLWGPRDGGPIDVDAVQARIDDPANEALAQSLREIGFTSAVDLFSTYSGSARDLKGWLADGIINTDRNLRVQYLGGLALNLYQGDALYRGMTRGVAYPEGLFSGSPATLAALRERITASLAGRPVDTGR